MSFALTTAQIRDRSKTVTRRIGWRFLKPGDLVQPVVKTQGIRKGAHVEPIGGPIRITDVRRERIDRLETEPRYGTEELVKEGYPLGIVSPVRFSAWFQATHPSQPDGLITRIEFSYEEVGAMTKTFWLSFCDSERPTGDQFLGVAVVDISEDEAAVAREHLVLTLPPRKSGGRLDRRRDDEGPSPGLQSGRPGRLDRNAARVARLGDVSARRAPLEGPPPRVGIGELNVAG